VFFPKAIQPGLKGDSSDFCYHVPDFTLDSGLVPRQPDSQVLKISCTGQVVMLAMADGNKTKESPVHHKTPSTGPGEAERDPCGRG
jgi:hypothetical protein